MPEDQQPQPPAVSRLTPGEPFLTLAQCQFKCCKSNLCGGIQFKPMSNFASARIRLKVGKSTPTQKLIQDSTIGVCKFYDGSESLRFYQKAPPSLSDILNPAILQDQKNRLLKALSGLTKKQCKEKCLETLACTGVEYQKFSRNSLTSLDLRYKKETGGCVIVQKYSKTVACKKVSNYFICYSKIVLMLTKFDFFLLVCSLKLFSKN